MKSVESRFHLQALREAVADTHAQADSVSDWSVGMQIEHCCLCTTLICRSLGVSQAPKPASFNPLRNLLLTTARIPRGKANASEVTLPKTGPSTATLHDVIDEAAAALQAALLLPANRWFDHPLLGAMTKSQALRVVQIHNRHHLKIINDIQAAVEHKRRELGVG